MGLPCDTLLAWMSCEGETGQELGKPSRGYALTKPLLEELALS